METSEMRIRKKKKKKAQGQIFLMQKTLSNMPIQKKNNIH